MIHPHTLDFFLRLTPLQFLLIILLLSLDGFYFLISLGIVLLQIVHLLLGQFLAVRQLGSDLRRKLGGTVRL